MALTDRDMRRLENTKQNSIEFQGKPSIHGMVDGQVAIEKKSNSQLALYRKKYGKLWKMYMSSDGNQYVDGTLRTNTLEYTHKFIDYRFFLHNFNRDIGTSEFFLPWVGPTEETDMDDARRSFLVPFNMTLNTILIRPETLSDTTADIRIKVKKQGNNLTVGTVATATYETDDLASNTYFKLNKSDFDNTPTVEAGEKVGLTILSGADPSGTIDLYITSVLRVEVVI